MLCVALWLSFAAAATTVIPPATTRQIAWWRRTLLVNPQLWSSLPALVPLILTASNSGRPGVLGVRWARDQLGPPRYHEIKPSPLSLRMRTPHTRAPGATPTTPMPLSSAPTIPATCVPWWFLSRQAVGSDVAQLWPPATFKSGGGGMAGCRVAP